MRFMRLRHSVVLIDETGCIKETCPIKDFAGSSFEAKLSNLSLQQRALAKQPFERTAEETKALYPND
jgi:hypothetical protein